MQMNRNRWIMIGAIVVILVAASIYWYYTTNNSGNSSRVAHINQPVPQSQMSQLQALALNNTLANKIGYGLVENPPQQTGSNVIMMVNGKPAVVYIGAEYCPFCAVTRWGFILALMRFGTLSSLHYMISNLSDYAPGTATFTFYNSSYQSQYISFISAEVETTQETPLQQITPLENAVQHKYSNGGIPFIDFGNHSIQSETIISPALINAYNWTQIVAMLGQSNSTVSQAIIGSANEFTAQICAITNYTPSSTCSQPYVKQLLIMP